MNKYHANMDSNHRSAKERARAVELKLLERAGKIQGLSEQVRFELLPRQDGEQAAFYVADFTYWENDKFVVEDVKGYKKGTAYALFVLKRKLMLYRYGIKIKET
jgi:hypothetical protein